MTELLNEYERLRLGYQKVGITDYLLNIILDRNVVHVSKGAQKNRNVV